MVIIWPLLHACLAIYIIIVRGYHVGLVEGCIIYNFIINKYGNPDNTMRFYSHSLKCVLFVFCFVSGHYLAVVTSFH